MCASNPAAIEMANCAAGSRSIPTVRLTTKSLIMASLPGWAPSPPPTPSGNGHGRRRPRSSVRSCSASMAAAGSGVPTPAAWWSLLGVAVLVELRHIGPQVANFLFALDAGENHLGARHLRAWIFDIFLE